MKPMPQYPSRRSPLLRCAFGIAAVAATLALGSFVESLADHYSAQAIAALAKSTLIAAR